MNVAALRQYTFALVLGLLFSALLFAPPQTAYGFFGGGVKVASTIAKITPNPRTLPDDEIVRLSRLSGEVRGTAKVGGELGRLNLPQDILEDTFLRIAIHQNKLSRNEAELMFRNLTGVPGFSSTLRKIIGNNEVGARGHLFELRMASEGVEGGFVARAIGQKFDDGLKRAPTDIDIILERGGRLIAIEAKNYGTNTRISLDMYRADLDTLVAFRTSGNNDARLFFSMANPPVNSDYLRRLKYEAAQRDIELVFGNARSSILQIRQLLDMK